MSARQWRRLHGTATIVWASLIIPTLLFWKSSILWIALMSIWANVATHWSAYQAARAESKSPANGNKNGKSANGFYKDRIIYQEEQTLLWLLAETAQDYQEGLLIPDVIIDRVIQDHINAFGERLGTDWHANGVSKPNGHT